MNKAIIFVCVFIALVLLILIFAVKYAQNKDDINYLNAEIERSFGEEKKYYKAEKRKLFWSLFFK